MESQNQNQISVDIPNFSGPLEVLLDLAKSQKVNLTEISITKLADQFLVFIKEKKDINLETASEFLLMATWLAYLKSKLLLPEEENDEFNAIEVAERLKLQLKKLELIRILSDQMLNKKRLGVHIYTRGMKGGIRSVNSPIYDISLYELLKTYARIQITKTFQKLNIPKLPVLTTEEGIKHIQKKINQITEWRNIDELVPETYLNTNLKKTGKSGIFAASLELTKEGLIEIKQKNLFEKIFVRKNN